MHQQSYQTSSKNISLNQLIGQHLIIGISGLKLTEDEKKFIVQNNIGGICLFSRNVANIEQIMSLCSEIQALRKEMASKSPLFIGIDMEGGRVARLKTPFTQWPPLKKIGDLDSPTVAFNFSYSMGLELKAVGINLDFAPCIDILTNPENKVIGDRSLSSDPEVVAKLGSAIIRGFMKSEVVSCVKHFPGHGNTLIDSHEDLPVETMDRERLTSIELEPFKKAFRSRVEMVMSAHIKFPNIDPQWPATLSEIFLKQLMRDELRYRGLIITDDLDMKAMVKHYPKDVIPVRALQAGADILLYCNEPESPRIALEAIENAVKNGGLTRLQLEESYERIVETKFEKIPFPEPLSFQKASSIVGNADHFRLSQAIARGEVPPGLITLPSGKTTN
jgi:beta-N-acetylhexosaminidase